MNIAFSGILFFILLLVICIAIPTYAVIRSKSRRKDNSQRCIGCGYSRRGLEADQSCPECNTPAGIVGTGIVADKENVSCRACGHIMNGQPWDATCSECGLPSAALPKFHRMAPRAYFTPMGFLNGFLMAIWVFAMFLLILFIGGMF